MKLILWCAIFGEDKKRKPEKFIGLARNNCASLNCKAVWGFDAFNSLIRLCWPNSVGD